MVPEGESPVRDTFQRIIASVISGLQAAEHERMRLEVEAKSGAPGGARTNASSPSRLILHPFACGVWVCLNVDA
jgi:hypothetical protein